MTAAAIVSCVAAASIAFVTVVFRDITNCTVTTDGKLLTQVKSTSPTDSVIAPARMITGWTDVEH